MSAGIRSRWAVRVARRSSTRSTGELPHVTQRINFAVVAKAPLERFRAHAAARGWRNARLLSSADTTYNRDYQAEAPDGAQLPIATVFLKRGGKIYHAWSSELLFGPRDPDQHPRHVDFMWPLGRSSTARPKVEEPTGVRRSTTADLVRSARRSAAGCGLRAAGQRAA